MYYKQEEIQEYIDDLIKENADYDEDYLGKDRSDIHHQLFNEDYYIIGTYKAKQWLGEKVWDVIDEIQKYEKDNFGESHTDLSNPEKVVNMYVYIVGEHLLNKMEIGV